MKCELTLRHYFEVLAMLSGAGYTFHSFEEDPDSNKKMIWLRHDIDCSPESALKMAKVEKDLNIRATYFPHTDSLLYDVISTRSLDVVDEIVELGHWIGRHVNDVKDIPVLPLSTDRVFSFHCPDDTIINKKIDGIVSTYEPKFFSNIKYISDSKRVWKTRCPCKGLNKLQNNIQILTHPTWWTEI